MTRKDTLAWCSRSSIPFPHRFAIAPATMRRVWGSSASAAVIDNKLIPPWTMISSWFASGRMKTIHKTYIFRSWLVLEPLCNNCKDGKRKVWVPITIHCKIGNCTCCFSANSFILKASKDHQQGCKTTRFNNPFLICFCMIYKVKHKSVAWNKKEE